MLAHTHDISDITDSLALKFAKDQMKLFFGGFPAS